MTKQQRLDRIRADIERKNICPDLANTAKNLVFGSGSIDAKIVFIGEAPGKKEDESGEPFVGAAGKFLDQMLLSINLQRPDIYITNIVKFRPPENRDPSVAEKEAFLPVLYAQLEVISPKVVVTLGRHSTSCFLSGMQISEIHGQPQTFEVEVNGITKKYTILPLYHPAAALYNGGLRRTLMEDFAKIPQLLMNTN